MIAITYCATGCVRDHLSDCTNPECDGCQPVQAAIGILCRRCHGQLVSLIGPPVAIEEAEAHAEAVATVTTWLADNLGQHLRAPGGDGRGRSESMDRTVDVAIAMGDLQIGFHEWADNLRTDHDWSTGPHDTSPEAVAAWMRKRLQQLAAWPPVVEMVTHLREAIDAAHAVAPWRPKDRHCVGVPCPTCRHRTLLIPAGHVDVWCQTCGATHGRDVYDRITALLAWEQQVEQRLERAGLDGDDLATLGQLHHALEVPKRTLERWRLDGVLEPVACLVTDRSQLYVAREAFAVATRTRRAG